MELDIRLDELNVLIGANASGKSNFVQLFTFVRDIVESGLENAISIQGGAQYLRNMNSGDANLTIELSIEPGPGDPTFLHGDLLARALSIIRSTYRFSLAFPGGRNVSIAEDELHVDLSNGPKPDSTIILKRTNNEYGIEGSSGIVAGVIVENLNSRSGDARQPVLLIENEFLRSILSLKGLKSIATYDIDPKGPKAGAFFGAKSELEPNADNLAIALDRILSNEEGSRKLLNLLKDVLPFVEGLEAEQMQDSSLFFNMRERFSREPMPAAFLSDGTINVISLIVILYFERKSVVVIEERERNLHPSLISKLVELFKDASRLKQVIVSTHNPEIVRYAEPGQLILVSRDASGSSHAERPADKEQVQRFLRDEIGMHELYIENLLEV
jgi:energy-coupling factor transporter ATP-binding protein EcfA2